MVRARCIISGAVGFGLVMGLWGSWAQPAWAKDEKQVEAVQAQAEIPEEDLLDVGIQVFNPGLPEEPETLVELEDEGIFSDVRKSESCYIPIQLKRTLQSTGFWGAVRLVPKASNADLMVTGTVLKSNGKKLELEVLAVDALGKKWLKEKYKREAYIVAYTEESGEQDPYQSLYNEIANDLLKARRKRKDDYVERVRTVSRLRFAHDLAPTAFEDYLKVDKKKGRYSIERLPAEGDPMMDRVERIRERDYMFIDTLNEFYADFYARMDEPYDDWRAYSYEEQVALDKLRKASRWQKILGAAAIIGGIYSSTKGRGGRAAGEVAILGGMAAIQDAMQKGEESKMHLQALQELAASLDSEVAPLLIDVEGEVMRLTGSVETQYATWRNLLRDIFATETGLPVDPNAEVERAKQDPNKN